MVSGPLVEHVRGLELKPDQEVFVRGTVSDSLPMPMGNLCSFAAQARVLAEEVVLRGN